MRISDWSSDVCSSDLQSIRSVMQELQENKEFIQLVSDHDIHTMIKAIRNVTGVAKIRKEEKSSKRTTGGAKRTDRKSVVSGKSVSVRVDLGGRRIIKKKRKIATNNTY